MDTFLESDRNAVISLCEGRPSSDFQRCLIRASLDVAKFFVLPSGTSVFPFKFDQLKASVEKLTGISV